MVQIFVEMHSFPLFTQEEEALLQSAQEGRTLSFSADTVKGYRETFEKASQFQHHDKTQTVLGHVTMAVSSGLVTMASAFPTSSFNLPVAATCAFVMATSSAFMGRSAVKLANDHIKLAKSDYDANVSHYLTSMDRYATHFASINYVSEMNDNVATGKKLALSDLAKLININNEYFKNACYDLAITVLQAKLMVAMQDNLIETFPIAHSAAAGPDSVIPNNYILPTLWDQIESAIPTGNKQRLGHSSGAKHSYVPPQQEASPNLLSALYKFYADGIKGHARTFQKPKADDYLPAISNVVTVTVPTFPSVEDLAARIDGYIVQKLDFPALEQK